MPHTSILYEDNAAIRELVSSLLVDEGCAVRGAGELAEAFALVSEGEISLVLTDSGKDKRELGCVAVLAKPFDLGKSSASSRHN